MRSTIFLSLFAVGCASLTTPEPVPSATPQPTPSPSPSPTPAPTTGAQPLQGWTPGYSEYVKQAILLRYPRLLQIEAPRIKDYCPAYNTMAAPGRLQFFVDFMAALTVPESSTHRAMIYREGTMKADPFTGYQVRSEGLFQLSYQDKNSYGPACDFGWHEMEEKSKAIADYNAGRKYGDGTRNIHNAYRNIECTLSIFDQQLFKYAKTSRFQNALANYWYVMGTNTEGKLAAYMEVRKALVNRTNVCASPNFM